MYQLIKIVVINKCNNTLSSLRNISSSTYTVFIFLSQALGRNIVHENIYIFLLIYNVILSVLKIKCKFNVVKIILDYVHVLIVFYKRNIILMIIIKT